MKKKHSESPHWGRVLANPFTWNTSPKKEPSPALREYAQKVANLTDAPKNIYVTDPDLALTIISERATKLLEPRGQSFVKDKYNSRAIEQLCLYFTQNTNFAGTLSKGIMLMGGYGVGKTFLLSLFANTYPDGHRFKPACALSHIVTPDQLINQHNAEGKTQMAYGTMQTNRRPKFHNYLLDELGGEVNISPALLESRNLTFAELDRTNIIATILHRRHRLFIEAGLRTHITTNLTEGGQIQALYGGKILSRINEMCNVIEITGHDRRK